jgi:TatD DNase family protein
VELADHPRVIGIGESGLDYFYDNAPRDRQAESFHAHCDAARRTGLPLIVHTRDADEDTIAILHEEYGKGPFPGLIHCYSTSPWLADKALEIGFSISFSGIVTFKKSTELQDTARRLPLDRLLVETDAPFLAPVPKRGKPNEPAYVAHTARFVAELRGMDVDEFAAATTDNFYRLFSKATPPAAA